MSGRGKPGGGLVQSHKPEDVRVTLNLRTTTSADTFVLDPPSSREHDTNDSHPSPFYIQIHASIKFSTHPTLPVTLSTWRTPLEREIRKGQEEGDLTSSPVWLNSALTPLRSTTDPSKLAGPPELGYVVQRRGGYSRDLRQSWDFLTVPPNGEEVVVRHLLPRESLRFYRPGGGRGEVKPEKGEKFVIGPSDRGLGTFWWKWGDLKGDLAEKKFRADEWFDGDGEMALEGGERAWVESEGENGFGLTMEVESEAEIEFV